MTLPPLEWPEAAVIITVFLCLTTVVLFCLSWLRDELQDASRARRWRVEQRVEPDAAAIARDYMHRYLDGPRP